MIHTTAQTTAFGGGSEEKVEASDHKQACASSLPPICDKSQTKKADMLHS